MQGIFRKTALVMAMAGALAACGGGGSGGDDAYVGTGELNVSVADAPVDGATAVWVTITGMHIKRTESSEERRVTLNGEDTVQNELQINLLELTNGASAALFANSVTSGEYQWIRFEVEEACIVFANDPGTCVALRLPAQNELKTAGSFTVPTNGVANITVDWDLRKGIVQQGSNYALKPVLHLRENDQVGSLIGSIQGVDCAEGEVGAVYIYSGSVTPDDIDGTGIEPFASVRVVDDTPDDTFFIGMLDPGTYTYALTCDALADNPETDNNATVAFYSAETVGITAGQQTAVIYAPSLQD